MSGIIVLLLTLLQNRVQTAFDNLPPEKQSKKALADYCGVKPPSVNDWFTGKTKSLKGSSLIKAAEYLNVREQWLADGNGPMDRSLSVDSQAEYVGKAPKQSLIPVSGFARLGDNGWYEEVSAPGSEGYVEATSSDPDAYVLMVKGDSMHPAIRNGWYVVVEPNKQPCAGEYAAILLQDGRKMVKEYLFSTAETVTVESVNGGERLSLRLEDVKVIHAIGSILMPNKHVAV